MQGAKFPTPAESGGTLLLNIPGGWEEQGRAGFDLRCPVGSKGPGTQASQLLRPWPDLYSQIGLNTWLTHE